MIKANRSTSSSSGIVGRKRGRRGTVEEDERGGKRALRGVMEKRRSSRIGRRKYSSFPHKYRLVEITKAFQGEDMKVNREDWNPLQRKSQEVECITDGWATLLSINTNVDADTPEWADGFLRKVEVVRGKVAARRSGKTMKKSHNNDNA